MEVPEKPTVKCKSEGKVNQEFIGLSTGQRSEEPFEEVKPSQVLFMHTLEGICAHVLVSYRLV